MSISSVINPFVDVSAHAVRIAFRDGRPSLVNFSGRTYCVRRVLREWSEKKLSWTGTYERLCYLLETNSNTLELHRSGERWHLERVVVDSADADSEILTNLVA